MSCSHCVVNHVSVSFIQHGTVMSLCCRVSMSLLQTSSPPCLPALDPFQPTMPSRPPRSDHLVLQPSLPQFTILQPTALHLSGLSSLQPSSSPWPSAHQPFIPQPSTLLPLSLHHTALILPYFATAATALKPTYAVNTSRCHDPLSLVTHISW